jgi:large subunit ribosomal protein L25
MLLKARKRKILGKKVKKLRKMNLIPAVVYGHNISSLPIEVEKKEFEKVFKSAGESTIIDLKIDDEKPIKVLIHDVSYHPLTDEIIHVDFYQIKEKEKVTVDVNLKFINESPAVKEKGGVLIHHLTKIKIECLPKDLVHEIEVDLSKLSEIDSLIRIKDLKIPPNIKVLENPEDVVASVSLPKAEEVKVEEKPEETKEKTEKPVSEKSE